MKKFILSMVLCVLSAYLFQANAQTTKDWGAIEFEAVASHAGGAFSPGMNGRLTAGYIVPSGKAGVYLDWGSGSGRLSDASHTLLLCGGLPFYTGERFSIVPKIGLGMATMMDNAGTRKYYLGSALSATLRYYLFENLYCGFDARFLGINGYSGDKFISSPEFGISVGFVL